MAKATFASFVAGLVSLLFAAGCAHCPIFQLDRPELERRLPDGISMSDFVERDWSGYPVTVDEKLARLGAYVSEDGKMRDGAGRPIEFFRHFDGGMSPGPDFLARHHERLTQLQQKQRRGECTLIEITRDPWLPGPR